MIPENVRVTKLDSETINEQALARSQKGIDLGVENETEKKIEENVNRLLKQLKGRATNFYLLSWQGNKAPYGVELNGKRIGWTQHGIVSSEEGKTIGFYDRLIEFGGETGRDHQMLIYEVKNQNDTRDSSR